MVEADKKDGTPPLKFQVKLRLDTLVEIQFYKHGGVMPYVMRGLVAQAEDEV
jgi:aconitase A